MRNTMAIALSITILAIAARGASAQQAAGRAQRDPVAAKAQFEQAEAYFREGLYAKAIESYRESYRLSGLSELLINIAQAHRLNGDKREAVAAYQQFVDEKPQHKHAAEVRRRIAELTRQIEDEEAAAKAADQTQDGAARAAAPTARALPPDPVIITRPFEARRGLQVAGIATGVVGLVSLGVGIKFGLDASRIEDELSGHEGPWTEELLARVDEGDRAERNMIIFVSLGATAVVTGTVLYWLGRPGKPDAVSMAIAPSGEGSGWALSLAGRF